MLLEKFYKISGELTNKPPKGLKQRLLSIIGIKNVPDDGDLDEAYDNFVDSVPETLITGVSVDEIISIVPEVEPILGSLISVKDKVTIDLWARYLKVGQSLSKPGWHFSAKPKDSEDDPDGMHIAIWQTGPGRFLTLNQDLSVRVDSTKDLQDKINNLPCELFSTFPNRQWMYGPMAAPYLTPPASEDGLSITLYVKMSKPEGGS